LPNAQNAGKKGYVSWIARIAVATGAILWLLHGQDWGKLAAVFHSLSLGYFVLSLAVYAFAQVVIAVRWWFLLRAQSIHIDVLAAVRLFFLGLFYSNVMPGSGGGDLVKAWYVTKHTNKRLEGALSVFVDRVIGLIGLSTRMCWLSRAGAPRFSRPRRGGRGGSHGIPGRFLARL
jgi:uncharacterized protein (TIRG00374 family)